MQRVRTLTAFALISLFAGTLFAQSAPTTPADRQRQMQQLQDRQQAVQQGVSQAPARTGQPQAQQSPTRSSNDGKRSLFQQTPVPPQGGTTQTGPASSAGSSAESRQLAAPRAPFQLTPEKQARLHQLLDYWESRSGKVKTYSCEFMRHDYDHVFGPKNPLWAKTKSEGIIRFSAPDKGEFRVVSIGRFQPPAAEGKQPTYPQDKDGAAEHWICNGTSVFELNAKRKQLIERKLPPEMQGNQIADGPLPFMFGAKKDKLLQRYWIQELKPPVDRKGEYWLEAYPRLAETAAEFQRVRVILDEKTFLPNAIEVYPPNYNPRTNPSRTVYVFHKRRVNDPINNSKEFFGRFISPKTPRGWKRIVETFNEPAPQPSVASAADSTAPPGNQPSQQR